MDGFAGTGGSHYHALMLVMVHARSYSQDAPSLRLLGRLWHRHPGYLNHVELERECGLQCLVTANGLLGSKDYI